MVYQFVLASLAGAVSAFIFAVAVISCAESLWPHCILASVGQHSSRKKCGKRRNAAVHADDIPMSRRNRVKWWEPIMEVDHEMDYNLPSVTHKRVVLQHGTQRRLSVKFPCACQKATKYPVATDESSSDEEIKMTGAKEENRNHMKASTIQSKANGCKTRKSVKQKRAQEDSGFTSEQSIQVKGDCEKRATNGRNKLKNMTDLRRAVLNNSVCNESLFDSGYFSGSSSSRSSWLAQDNSPSTSPTRSGPTMYSYDSFGSESFGDECKTAWSRHYGISSQILDNGFSIHEHEVLRQKHWSRGNSCKIIERQSSTCSSESVISYSDSD